MTKAKDIVEKFEVSNVGNTKPPQWDGKKGDSYLMWKTDKEVHMCANLRELSKSTRKQVSMSDAEVRVCVISRELAWTRKRVSVSYTETRVCTISRGEDSGQHKH
jgi:hypothetical protein